MEIIMVGLTSAQAEEMARRGYQNIQVDKTAKTTKDILKENILTYFNLIFLIITILLIIAGAFSSLTFLPIIIANTLIGIVQEIHAKKVLDDLSLLNEPTAQVVRDNKVQKIPIEQLVLNDVILLKSGSQIPADAVVVHGEISVNEALLTGEADEILKTKGSELMSGSFVVFGECYAQLKRVGKDAYISKIMQKARVMPKGEQSEMIRSINHIVIFAGVAIIPIGILLFYQSFFTQGLPFAASVTAMVAAVIGMIPEGLYLLVSIALAISSTLLARKKVMLHDMKSIETLARVNTLCVDKTGTITDNSMLVAEAIPAVEADDEMLKKYKALVGEYASVLPDDNITMRAIRTYFPTYGTRTPLSSLPFSSRYKYSSVQFNDATYVLGAPEYVLGQSYENYREQIEEYARKGLRVVVFGLYLGEKSIYSKAPAISAEEAENGNDPDNWEGRRTERSVQELPEPRSLHVPEEGLYAADVRPIFYILLQNPLRESAKETFTYFVEQGVEVKVISGDNPITVSEVAKQAGIQNAENYIDATWLTDDQSIEEASQKYTIFGRVSPDQKKKIVEALQKAGRTVAMTGDGVNDILAMKSADCSIAMAAGSDAAVQAAQVVLLDSDFAHMPQIVGEGRRTINNIERSATLFLVKNLFSLFLSIFSILAIYAYPLQPEQISLISMFNIGIPAFFLAMEPNNKRIQGRFLRKVVLTAMPAALTDFLAIAALVVFGNTFNVAEADISVAATFLLAIVGFMILVKISSPLNKYHIGVIVGCIVSLILCVMLFNNIFAITSISTECIMLFGVFAIATEPCMRYLSLIFELTNAKIEEIEKIIRQHRAGV